MRLPLLVAAAVTALAAGAADVNERPIIGILTLPNDLPEPFSGHRSYFPASYVKWVESGGARAVPIPYYWSADKIAALLPSLNGFLFTGGGALFCESNGDWTPFATTAAAIYAEVEAAAKNGEWVPLWGTCLGHELALTVASGNCSLLSRGFNAENYSIALDYTVDAPGSLLFGSAPADVYSILGDPNQAVTLNAHQGGVTPESFAASSALSSRFKVLSTNADRGGRVFVSTTEAASSGLPVFTSQWHPEKPLFEWDPQEAMVHTLNSTIANGYTQRFLVEQARKNSRSFPSPADEAAELIYNYSPVYTGNSTSFQQCYFFDE